MHDEKLKIKHVAHLTRRLRACHVARRCMRMVGRVVIDAMITM